MNYANENIFDEIVAGQSEYLLRIAYLYVKDWQVAELLSPSDNTVKTRLRRARQVLKKQLPSTEWEVLSNE